MWVFKDPDVFFPPPYSGHNKDIASPWEFGAGDNCCHGWYHKSKLSWLYGGDIQVRALTVHTLYLSTEMKSESKIHVLGKSKRAERVRRWTAFFEQAQFKPFGPTHERFLLWFAIGWHKRSWKSQMMIRFVALKKQRPEVKYTTTLLPCAAVLCQMYSSSLLLG